MNIKYIQNGLKCRGYDKKMKDVYVRPQTFSLFLMDDGSSAAACKKLDLDTYQCKALKNEKNRAQCPYINLSDDSESKSPDLIELIKKINTS